MGFQKMFLQRWNFRSHVILFNSLNQRFIIFASILVSFILNGNIGMWGYQLIGMWGCQLCSDNLNHTFMQRYVIIATVSVLNTSCNVVICDSVNI